MRSILVLSLLVLSWPVLAQNPPVPQMPPPPPAVQAPPPTPVKPVTVTKSKAKAKGDKQTSQNCRDATSGKYVTPAYAKQNPTTTVCETAK
jgi:hypothetical protein